MNDNPTDVLTLLLRSAAPIADLEQALDDAGLVAKAHRQAAEDSWPTLQAMIDAGHNLVMFVEPLPPDSEGGGGGAAPDPAPAAIDVSPLAPSPIGLGLGDRG